MATSIASAGSTAKAPRRGLAGDGPAQGESRNGTGNGGPDQGVPASPSGPVSASGPERAAAGNPVPAGDRPTAAPGRPGTSSGPAAAGEVAPAAARRRELAAFLRSRRERISPEQVGLPDTGRRRTPGLRREEVAQLATVGVTWYTWLEQGRDIQVSAQVLQSVARALMLDPTERAHLFVLAGAEDPAPIVECATVTPAARALLAQLEPMPAAVMNSRYDVLAHNRAYTWIVGDLDALPFEDRNLMWLAFTGSDFQRSLVDIEEARPSMVARFRTAMADHGAEPAWKALLARLRRASPEFDEMWQQHEVAGLGNGLKRFLVPGAGLLRFEYTNLWLGPRPGPRLVAYTPQDDDTRRKLEELASGLRGRR